MTFKIKIQVITFIFLLSCLKIIANDIIIYNEYQTNSDTINFGVVLLNDFSTTSFIIKNNSERKIQLGYQSPSYILGRPPGYDKNDFEEFSEIGKPLLVDINPNDSFRLVIQYNAKPDLVNYPIGRKWAYLKLGVYDPLLTPIPQDTDIIYEKNYILTAVKTLKALDCYDNKINFDSVYVYPKDTIYKRIIIESSTNKKVIADSHFLKHLNPYIDNPKFFVQPQSYPIIFESKHSYKDWIISYYPTKIGKDSAMLSVYYQPNPIENPTLIDSVIVKFYGTAVEQKLKIIDCDVDHYNDTINLGDVFVGSKKEVNIILKNIANIPYGVISQKIYDLPTYNVSKIFTIEKPFLANGTYLFENQQDTFQISLTPTQMGNLKAQLVIESNILSRKILGAPKESAKYIINLKARATEPIINSATQNINFGNVFIHPNCPTAIDTFIFIANNGNMPLEVYDIIFDPPPPSPFSVEPYNFTIEPKSQKLIKITFSTENQPIGVDIQANMIIISNCREPNNYYTIQLKAKGIEPPIANISLPTLRASPGKEISIPILVEKNKISYANTFSCTIIYDKTLLKFHKWNKLGTASENAELVSINENNGKTDLYIKLPPYAQQKFLERDTLIILNFHTFLGEKISTPLTISNPQFGNEYCSNVLNSVITNGIFSIDSVCGLNYKAVPFPSGKFQIIKISPNPSNSYISIEFELPYKTKTTLNLYNYTGDKLKSLTEQVYESGRNSIKFSIEDVPSGLYFLELNIGTNFDIKPLFITK